MSRGSSSQENQALSLQTYIRSAEQTYGNPIVHQAECQLTSSYLGTGNTPQLERLDPNSFQQLEFSRALHPQLPDHNASVNNSIGSYHNQSKPVTPNQSFLNYLHGGNTLASQNQMFAIQQQNQELIQQIIHYQRRYEAEKRKKKELVKAIEEHKIYTQQVVNYLKFQLRNRDFKFHQVKLLLNEEKKERIKIMQMYQMMIQQGRQQVTGTTIPLLSMSSTFAANTNTPHLLQQPSEDFVTVHSKKVAHDTLNFSPKTRSRSRDSNGILNFLPNQGNTFAPFKQSSSKSKNHFKIATEQNETN